MAKVTNISNGPRGAYLDGKLVMANPGETIDADDYAPEWFKKAGAAKDEGGALIEKPLAKMNRSELDAANAALPTPIVFEDSATNAHRVEAIEKARAAA